MTATINDTKFNKILVLGSGYVAYPCVDHLARYFSNIITVVSRTKKSIDKARDYFYDKPNVHFDVADITANNDKLASLVKECDLVISLLPYVHHPLVFELALKYKKHVVTTSYISDAMAKYDAAVKSAGLTFFNEVGLDPGIDHVYAAKIIKEVQRKGGKVLSFTSYCGGIPTPEHMNDNPLQYKFSWSSKGVLLALKNNAKFISNEEVLDVPAETLMDYCKYLKINIDCIPTEFVGYPNRDSSIYSERYNLKCARDIIRGTLRYQSFPLYVRLFQKCNLLSSNPDDLNLIKKTFKDRPVTWLNLLAHNLGAKGTSICDIKEAIIKANISTSKREVDSIMKGLDFMGLLCPKTEIEGSDDIVSCLALLIEKKMRYGDNEPDMVILVHEFIVEYEKSKERIICEGIWKGEGGINTAMSKTVGETCAITVQLILDEKISQKGVLAPITWELAKPIYEGLRDHGITMSEITTTL